MSFSREKYVYEYKFMIGELPGNILITNSAP